MSWNASWQPENYAEIRYKARHPTRPKPSSFELWLDQIAAVAEAVGSLLKK